jgi:hypothetical protein
VRSAVRLRRFDLDQSWIAKLRQLKPPVPIWAPHHDDVDLGSVEPVHAVHPRALDSRLAFVRHAERGEKSDSGCRSSTTILTWSNLLIVMSLAIATAVRGGPGRPFSRVGGG